MKLRTDFVTNSSSSNYVVIGKSGKLELEGTYKGRPFDIGEEGHSEFGWEVRKYKSVYDRINFAALQVMGEERYSHSKNMLYALIKKHTGATEVNCILSDKYNPPGGCIWGYIDHQSTIAEGENTEIFASKETLKSFLFDEDSYIQGGNDNE